MTAVLLSDLHVMLGQIRRANDAHFINRVANDPSVYPFVRGYFTERIDLSTVVANRGNVAITGEHGYLFFQRIAEASFEVHTAILPAGRGKWGVRFTQAAVHYLFTRTIAFEFFTRVPKGNNASLGLTRLLRGRYEFERKDGWVQDLDPIPCDIYSWNVVDWIRHAPGLAERGAWFHDRLESEYARLGRKEPSHPDDAVHDRAVGAACEMILSGQPDKGCMLYNRWALMAGYQPIEIVAREPLTINIRDALVIVRSDDFWIPALCQPQP